MVRQMTEKHHDQIYDANHEQAPRLANNSWPHIFLAPEALRSRCDCGFDFVGFFCGAEKSLIQKGCDNCDNSDDDERADTIKLIELRQVVEEKFHDCGSEQAETCVADRGSSFAHADNEQKQGKQGPGDAVAHIARETS